MKTRGISKGLRKATTFQFHTKPQAALSPEITLKQNVDRFSLNSAAFAGTASAG